MISFHNTLTYNKRHMYQIVMPDNDIDFFRDREGRQRCIVCRQLTAKWTEDLSAVPIERFPRRDVTTSVDGIRVVLPRAKEAMEAALADQFQFDPLQRGLYAMMPRLIVPFDAVARETRFVKQCLTCGEWESIVGATPVFLVPGTVLPAECVARTDLVFGSNDEKGPLLLAGDYAASKLAALRLSGCELVPQLQTS
jgi:hypothetical protein